MRTGAIAGLVAVVLLGSSALQAQEAAPESAPKEARGTMKIRLVSVFVQDQDRARTFYTQILGFTKKHDLSLGEFNWLTVVSPEELDGAELLLEPNDNPAAKTYQEAIYKQGMPAITFAVDDIQKEYERLRTLGVKFTMKPTEAGTVTVAVFDDTCGNLIQMVQE